MVGPPDTTTALSASARLSRPSASSRVLPRAASLANIGPNSGGMLWPSAMPVSTRSPGPVGMRNSVTTPGDAAKPLYGSSAFRRTSIACPVLAGGTGVQPPAARHVEFAA